jgi:NAD(P)-dependent dehydrogenase (short-subunit alcohol dehydrogenase family)
MADGQLAGKVAIITGASRGIGEAIARGFLREGATIVLAARKQDGLDAVVHALNAPTGRVFTRATHVGKPEDVEALAAFAVDKVGIADILVNNAATNPYFGPMMGLEWGAWDKTFEVNLRGTFALTRAVVNHLNGRPASIINVTSVVGMSGAPFQGIYAMTKAALISMTQTLAVELGPLKIRVNAIAPGLIDTKFAKTLIDAPDISGQFVTRTALGRVGQPDELAGAAIYLASDAASYVTGQTLVVDGGYRVG